VLLLQVHLGDYFLVFHEVRPLLTPAQLQVIIDADPLELLVDELKQLHYLVIPINYLVNNNALPVTQLRGLNFKLLLLQLLLYLAETPF
jgi:hypothetical protein